MDSTYGMTEEQLAARYGVTVEQWRAGKLKIEENEADAALEDWAKKNRREIYRVLKAFDSARINQTLYDARVLLSQAPKPGGTK